MSHNQIELFLQSQSFAVVGASSNRDKYGNKVLRCYLQHGKTVYPINPREKVIEGLPVLSSLNDLPDELSDEPIDESSDEEDWGSSFNG